MQSLGDGYEFLFIHHPRPMWIYDLETLQFLAVNERAVDHYGYTADEFLQMRITDIRPPEEVEPLRLFITSTWPSPGAEPTWTHVLKDGTWIKVRVQYSRVEYADRAAVMVAVEDVSKEEYAQQELRGNRALIEQAAAIAGIGSWGVWMHDVERLEWSPEMHLIYGTDPTTFVPTTAAVTQFIFPDDLAANMEVAQHAITAGEPDYSTEMRLVRADGELRWLRSRARILYNADGTPRQIVGVCIDVTEEKRRLEVERALAREAELRRLHDHFVSMLAHEFRQPLQTIQSSAELLYNFHPRMDEGQRLQRIENIRTQITHLVALVEDVREMARAETAGLSYHPEPFDLVALCREIVEETESLIADARDLRFEHDTDAYVVMADKKLIRLSLVNLINNAVKYSPEGSTIWLRLRVGRDTSTLEVQDQGIGIPERDQERLFEPFFRAGNVGERPGSGLGLAIVKQAVEAHRGTILVRSAMGRGTVFTVLLPKPDLSN